MSETQDATNPEADELEEVAEGTEAQGDDQDQDQDETEEVAESDEPEEPAPELEEIELEGQKYSIPKALKGAFMMHGDYTKKTQEVAEAKRALEAERTQQAESFEAFRTDHVKIATQEARIADLTKQRDAYQGVDWDALREQDADLYDQHRANQKAIRDAIYDAQEGLDIAKGELKTKETGRLEQQQQKIVAEFQQTMTALQDPKSGIPEWGPAKIDEVQQFAGKEFGLTAEDLLNTTDPRAWKVLHRLMEAERTLSKQTTAKTIQKQAAVKPAVTTKGGSFSGAGVHDNLPIDEWTRRRNAQVAKQRAG